MKWLHFSDLFSFLPPSPRLAADAVSTSEDSLGPFEYPLMRDGDGILADVELEDDRRWRRIRFDNTVRAVIAAASYLACLALRAGGVIASLMPITLVFLIYAVVEVASCLYFRRDRIARWQEVWLCAIDIIGVSLAVYLTGGPTSPLYFLYFIPLIIHAFHRDWGLVLFNGVGGVVLYAIAMWNSFTVVGSTEITDLGARLFFMLISVSIASLALYLLRREDEHERKRLRRLQTLALIGQRLNRATTLPELSDIAAYVATEINNTFSEDLKLWSRFLLGGSDASLLHAVEGPVDAKPELKQSIAMHACPAAAGNRPFDLEDARTGTGCATEQFSFGSHLCLPISGSENETFGVLFCGSPIPHAFGTSERQFLYFVARSMGLAVQRLKRMAELRKAVEMNSCVMASFIGATRSVEVTVDAILEGVRTILTVDQASLFLWDPGTQQLRIHKVNGEHAAAETGLAFRMGESWPGKTLESGKPLSVSHVDQDPIYRSRRTEMRALLCLPLRNLKDEPIGVIAASRFESRQEFSTEEVDVASTFATRAAVALEGALINENQRRALSEFDTGPEQKAA